MGDMWYVDLRSRLWRMEEYRIILGVLFCKLQDWGCYIYKGDSAEIFIEFLDIIINIDSILRV